ncbi:histone deacetylase A-like protein [Coniochaeta sp. 2T2.1]|nr:histone deacetylase A-like protein [Coniochaeta sp. 2T2.1]
MCPAYDGVMDDDHPMEDAHAANGFGLDRALTSTTQSQSDDEDFDEGPDYTNGHQVSSRRRSLLPTGCCYDDRMKLHTNADFGQSPHHPEDPSRIESIMRTFKQNGLVYTGSDADLAYIITNCPTKYMWRIPAREATREEILKVHLPRHYDWVRDLSKTATAELRRITKELDKGRESLYVGSMSFEAALISAGGAVETCKSVVAGTVKNAFAIIRPPGHHAERDESMGFCLFNNVPIAAKTCQDMYPDTCRKIMILDWDVHHGNGIQNMFYDDPNILYISIHVYADGEFYPGKAANENTPDGGLDQCGAGPGAGKNVNIGWTAQGMGDGEYLAAFQKIVMPIGQEFNPDLVIISAGFDAADGDELGGCFVTPPCYAHMTHMLMSLAGGKVAVCLEGGYNLEAISNSALAVAQTLMGEPPPKMDMPKLNRDAAKVLAKVQAYQSQYWECMRPGVLDTNDFNSETSMRLHDVVRNAQRQVLSREPYYMVPLYIQRDALFRSFENQVLVTRNIHEKKQILFIIHDPPELHAQPDPIDNLVEPHNAWVSDGVIQYIEWAIKNGFGVMDVNVPAYITKPDDIEPHTEATNEAKLQDQMRTLVTFLWDNYIQLYDHEPEIFLMGVGQAYLGIKILLLERSIPYPSPPSSPSSQFPSNTKHHPSYYLADVKSRVSGVVNFVNGDLRSVRSEIDPDLSAWYKEHSRVYVTGNHACWQNADYARKVGKRRFGTVVRSSKESLVMMMREHAEDVKEWILRRCEEVTGDTTDDDKAVV